MHIFILTVLMLTGFARAHLAAWAKGMYCINGTDANANPENNAGPVAPLANLAKEDWWFHHIDKCDQYPPAEGDFLELPAGDSFTVEIANNRAYTSLSYGGKLVTEWGDGGHHPEGYSVDNLGGAPLSPDGCIMQPNMHAKNESDAAGSAFAISYTSDMSQVTPENLIVFSVRIHTPFKMVTKYDVPAALPACPPGGCICAWGWVPNGCGQLNMYHHGFRCKVTNATSVVPVAAVGKPATWCETTQDTCVKGPKQMIYWKQATGNNIVTDAFQADGAWQHPGYNSKLGFYDGAQNDIFVTNVSNTSSSVVVSATAPATTLATTSSSVITSTASTSAAQSLLANLTATASSSPTHCGKHRLHRRSRAHRLPNSW